MIAALLALAVAARAQGWKDLDGRWCPELAVDRWLNTGGQEPTNESLKGKVWVLEFFGAG